MKVESYVWVFATPWPVACQAPLSMEFPGKITGVGSHSLLQGIFSTQASNLGLLHFRQILYHLSHQGSPSPVCHYNPTTSLTTSSYKDAQSLMSWSCSCPAPPTKETELSIWLQFTSNHCLNCAQLLDQVNLFHFYSLLDGYFSVTVKTYFKKSVINFSS